ncbi:hypothetical protein MYX84_02925 [Acidobacteria bacterium AH-259-O06]|nr:hypothetical protein [Acidobacteria bacterium AH-259-L09]MDA2928894.1 hypothetical protein [Acidobacteria bacterium AH-259-O06]
MIGCITLFCVVSWALVSITFAPGAAMEIFLGMLVPLLVGIATILMVERIYRKESQKLTSFMAKAFLAKMVLYAVYMTLIVGLYSFQPIPFVISFTVYFTGLHMAEALYFRTMFSTR